MLVREYVRGDLCIEGPPTDVSVLNDLDISGVNGRCPAVCGSALDQAVKTAISEDTVKNTTSRYEDR